MSDHRAIAAVTASVKRLLYRWVTHDIGTSIQLSLGRPDPAGSSSLLTLDLFLYHIAQNPYMRNDELPMRRSDGSVSSRARLSLDLHFLISVYGGSTPFHAQAVLGSAMRALHTTPVLSRDLIEEALDAEVGGDSSHPLDGSDLAQQIELVRLIPLSMSLEEHSKLWSIFFQVPYALSVAWQASVVFIDAATAPTPILPVRSVQVFALPKPIIQLVSASSSLGEDEPITAASTVLLEGSGLKGDSTWVRIGGVDYAPASVSPKKVSFDLSTIPTDTLRAGIQAVAIVHHPVSDDGDRLDFGFESNAIGMAVRPTFSVATTPAPSVTSITLDVSPAVERRQRVKFYLYGATSSYAFEVPPPSTATTSTLTISLGDGVPAGSYLMRLQVDGAQSTLTTDGTGAYVGPEVTLA